MPDWLSESFNSEADVSVWVLLSRQAVAFALGCVVAGVYWLTQQGGARRSRNGASQPIVMMATLVLLTVLIGMIGSVVGSNIARAFSLVGALSIVRFRTVVEDTRDTAFVIFAVAVGMAVGAGYLKVPLVGIPFVALGALLFRPRAEAAPVVAGKGEPWLATIRLGTAFGDEPSLAAALGAHTLGADLTEVATSRQGAAVDRTYSVHLRAGSVTALVDALNGLQGVQQVDVRKQT
ncbi:MAG TPA: DUF4956 domain-containing protein [Phycisphaerales bacterium]|nr:DUF4956 domain-containing protein [Phycisphaerales bacterium]